MSEKRNVPTFRLYLFEEADCLEGPVVSPDRQTLAENLTELHELFQTHGGLLIYSNQWIYVPLRGLRKAARGTERFSLPWPLTT